ncbi:hypothetical protein P4S83_17650, partial [Aneurinibacillus thermoaerophilus]|nr:hypothetical protein [Aneurinibacillus thermoaerophilus]
AVHDATAVQGAIAAVYLQSYSSLQGISLFPVFKICGLKGRVRRIKAQNIPRLYLLNELEKFVSITEIIGHSKAKEIHIFATNRISIMSLAEPKEKREN